MSKKSNTSAPAQNPVEATKPVSYGVATICNVTERLWEHAASDLSESELRWFSSALGRAQFLSDNLIDTLNGIGCLVNQDGRNGVGAGNFQSQNDVSTLLFFIAEYVDHIQALILVGDSATDRLIQPELYR